MQTHQQALWVMRHGIRIDFTTPEWKDDAARPKDPPLAHEGLEQAREAGRRLRGESISLILSSPFLRTVQTAAVVAREIGVEVHIEQGLCEHRNPDWFPGGQETLSPELLKKDYACVSPEHPSIYVPQEEERVSEDTYRRSGCAVDAILEKHKGNLLLVTHGWPVQGIVTHLCGCPREDVEVHCSGLNQLKRQDDGWRLVYSGNDYLTITEDTIRFA